MKPKPAKPRYQYSEITAREHTYQPAAPLRAVMLCFDEGQVSHVELTIIAMRHRVVRTYRHPGTNTDPEYGATRYAEIGATHKEALGDGWWYGSTTTVDEVLYWDHEFQCPMPVDECEDHANAVAVVAPVSDNWPTLLIEAEERLRAKCQPKE